MAGLLAEFKSQQSSVTVCNFVSYNYHYFRQKWRVLAPPNRLLAGYLNLYNPLCGVPFSGKLNLLEQSAELAVKLELNINSIKNKLRLFWGIYSY